jgi:hypothetical protein
VRSTVTVYVSGASERKRKLQFGSVVELSLCDGEATLKTG